MFRGVVKANSNRTPTIVQVVGHVQYREKSGGGGGGAGFVATTNLNFGGSRLPSNRFSLGSPMLDHQGPGLSIRRFWGKRGETETKKGISSPLAP